MEKELKLFILSLTFSLLVASSLAKAQTSAKIVDNSLNPVNLYFTGTASDPKTWYQDAMDDNPDVGIEVCGIGQKYVGATYALNVGGNWKYVLVSYRSSSEALSYTDQTASSDCYYTTPGYLTISPSHLETPSPNPYFAAFPGRLYIAYDTSSNPGSLSNFILTDNYLLGDYSFSRSYDQATNKIEVDTPSISITTSAGSFTKSATDPSFGVSDDRRMVVGICNDDAGEDCYSGVIVPTEANFPLYLYSGASPVDDQHTYQRYVVINGIGKPICIGANLIAHIDSVSPNPIYYSQNLTINFTIQNKRDVPTEVKGGNVKITTDFYVEVKIYRADNSSDVVFDRQYLITQDFNPDDSMHLSIIWPAYARSGDYEVEVIADPTNVIKECSESDNSATASFTLKPIIIPEIWINGNRTNVFPFVGSPFNLTLHLKNSDGLNVSNATVKLIERNGISPFVPLQVWNSSVNTTTKQKVATVTINEVEFPTDYYGYASLTIIPTGNPLYAPEYAYLGVRPLVGDYQINLTGNTYSGEPFVFVINGQITHDYPFQVENYWKYENITTNHLPNENSFVETVMNTVYTIFAKFWKVVAG